MTFPLRALLLLLALLLAPAAHAGTQACLTSVLGQDIPLAYASDDDALKGNQSTREWLFGGYGKITCPGFVTLRHLTPDLTDDQRGPFCLIYDDGNKSYLGFTLGERDAWLECKAPSGRFCKSVNTTKDTALAVSSAIARAAVAPQPAAGGTSVLDATSGAVIASGAGSYIASTLGTAASTALAAISAPAALTAAAVTVVAVGGAVYVCN